MISIWNRLFRATATPREVIDFFLAEAPFPLPHGVLEQSPAWKRAAPDLDVTPCEAWSRCVDTVIFQWTIKSPGSRPPAWWRWNAPAEQVPRARSPANCAHRRRIGGRGTPAYEVYPQAPTFYRGLPDEWATTGDAADRPGRVFAVDPRDPPIFESEAAYLLRHKLFLPGERSQLTREHFEPIRVAAT